MLIDRRSVLTGLIAGAAQPAFGNIAASPRPAPRPGPAQPVAVLPATAGLVASAGLTGQVAFRLAEAVGGRVLIDRSGDLALPPASVTKAVTAAYALDHLGPGHRFATDVIATGPIRSGRLAGDLILAGGGAPGLSTDALAALAEQIGATGLRGIDGRFLYWEGALPRVDEIAPAQPDWLGYNPAVSGLNLNYNRVHFAWRSTGGGRYAVDLDARSEARRPAVGSIDIAPVAGLPEKYVHLIDPESGRESWRVAAGQLGSGGARWLPVRRTGAYAADVFRTMAAGQGIALPPPEPATGAPDGLVMASLPSSPVADIATGMLRFSTNLTAEVLGLSATSRRLRRLPADLPASGAAMTDWAADALGMTASGFVDHSGLSEDNRASAADLAGALVTLGPDGPLVPLLRSYPVLTEDSRPTAFDVRAKTGTLNFVSALSGYIYPVDGPPLVFAILTADLDRRAAIPPGGEESPPGSAAWTGRSRRLQFDLVRLWGRHAAADPALRG